MVSFLYILMRDHLPAGVVEGIVCGWEQRRPGVYEAAFSNDWLAAYAVELEARLQGAPPAEALALAHAVVRAAQGNG